MSFSLSDLRYMDDSSTHTREIPVVCDSCGAEFDVALAPGEEFSDLAAEDRPRCCEEPDLGVDG